MLSDLCDKHIYLCIKIRICKLCNKCTGNVEYVLYNSIFGVLWDL